MADPIAPDRGNSDLLRSDIQSGKTKDKVAFPDPAAAPLGSDAEAGGSPPTQAEVREARRAERRKTAPKGRTPALAIVVLGTLVSVALGGWIAVATLP